MPGPAPSCGVSPPPDVSPRCRPQDFPLLRLDDVVDDQSNILGFSMLNSTHAFYLEFLRSLNLSWREGCSINPYPGPAVRPRTDTKTVGGQESGWAGFLLSTTPKNSE